MKLTKTQQELYDALQAGADCIFSPYMGRFNPQAHYTVYVKGALGRRCTAAANALLEKGLVEKFNRRIGGDHELRIKLAIEQHIKEGGK